LNQLQAERLAVPSTFAGQTVWKLRTSHTVDSYAYISVKVWKSIGNMFFLFCARRAVEKKKASNRQVTIFLTGRSAARSARPVPRVRRHMLSTS